MSKNHKCKLLPYKREDVISIQDAQQKAGWEITAFDLPRAWQHTRGEGVKIAVLDTGCDLEHPDLADNLLPGVNYVKFGEPPIDDCGHGSHVTGILVAIDNEIGMVGVCPKAKVMPVKVLDSKGNGNMLCVSAGIKWAADNGADFIQMSLGTPIKVQQVRKAIQYAMAKGVITFCAAGNAGNTKEIFYPANYPETISIGAIDKNFKRAKFSNIGENLNFMAPGVEILSTVPKNWYAMISGTSQASPFACGVAALVLSYAKKTGKLTLKTPDDYKELFKKYTIPLTDNKLNQKLYHGFGIIDPRKLEEALRQFESSPTTQSPIST